MKAIIEEKTIKLLESHSESLSIDALMDNTSVEQKEKEAGDEKALEKNERTLEKNEKAIDLASKCAFPLSVNNTSDCHRVSLAIIDTKATKYSETKSVAQIAHKMKKPTLNQELFITRKQWNQEPPFKQDSTYDTLEDKKDSIQMAEKQSLAQYLHHQRTKKPSTNKDPTNEKAIKGILKKLPRFAQRLLIAF